MMNQSVPNIQRRITRQVKVGNVAIGGNAPVSIQSMTNTQTSDVAATLAQVRALAAAGCEIVRVATPTAADTAALKTIVAESPVPIVADVHFHFQRALEAIAAGVHKIRLNPGNIEDRGQVVAVIQAARQAGIPIRVGVNEGSVVRPTDAGRARRRERPLVDLMVETLKGYLGVFRDEGFEDLVLSAKSHDALTTVAVYQALSRQFNYPLHLGLTHAGTLQTGSIRSAAALGALLCAGIGDTIRVSLAGDPVPEVEVARELLWSLRLRERTGIELIACPTCGRTTADVAELAEQVRRELADVKRHVRVAVMGCVVNGPGEAEGADVAACCGQGKAAIYRRGRLLKTVPTAEIVPTLAALVRELVGAK